MHRSDFDSNAPLLENAAAISDPAEEAEDNAVPAKLSKAQQRKLKQVQEAHRRREQLSQVSGSMTLTKVNPGPPTALQLVRKTEQA